MIRQVGIRTPNRPKLLLVDAEHELLEALRLRLEQEDFEVITASSGTQALQAIEVDEIALIVIDPELNDMNGIKLGALIKENSSTPFLFITSNSAATYQKAAMSVGALTILSKRHTIDDLAAQIQLAFNQAIEFSNTQRINRRLVKKLNKNDKRENLIGAYMALWGEEKRRVKATLDKFARSQSVSIDKLAELHERHCELKSKVRAEYTRQLDEAYPEMLRDLQRFHDSAIDMDDDDALLA